MSDAEQTAPKTDDPPVEAVATEAEAPEVTAAQPPEDRTSAGSAAPEAGPTVTDTVEAPALSPAVADALQQAEDWRKKAYQYAADLDNLRKRFAKEKQELRKVAAEGLLRDLLPVVDNLERAVEHAGEAIHTPLGQGVKMVLRQFIDELGKHGATSFQGKGEPFDPQIHEAMSQIPTADVPPGHVYQVFQRGWYLGERLLRPAMVIVGSELPEAPAERGPDTDAAAAVAPEESAGETAEAEGAAAEAREPAEG